MVGLAASQLTALGVPEGGPAILAVMADQGQDPLPGAAAPPGADSKLPGPYAVGDYAVKLQGFLRKRARVQVIGEVTGLRLAGKAAYFELRDARGAVPCAMWRSDWDRLGLPDGAVRDGAEVVVEGGPDYYPGSATASPSFSFRCTRLRLAGEGDLLARLVELRRRLGAEGLFEPQKLLPRPGLPRAIGIVTGRGSAAEADLLAGLARRSWAGRAVFAHPPVQDRHAAPQIARALSDLAAVPEVEVIVVARGGGSLADLWAFCDETLCRTVALLRVPVVSAIGHESDRTLLDDVAAACCSTPTHAIEEAIQIDVAAARGRLSVAAARLADRGREAAPGRARRLAAGVRALAHHTDGQRRYLHQKVRELRATSAKSITSGAADASRRALVLARKRSAALHGTEVAATRLNGQAAAVARHGRTAPEARQAALRRIAQTLAAHEPERVLERGYALVTDAGEEDAIVTSAAEARRRRRLRVRFSDDDVRTEVIDDD
ncbi:MAG TPA: exodeoxyribonuclease VII large subunit [Solirubrobacterales bacterium]|nr:exodeoxyribonuclease VII large subunit [Solirubrobacterales bacterium]